MRREHVLDRQLEQRAQPRGDLLARHAGAEPPLVDLEALAEVDERVAGDHRPLALDPEHGVVRLVPGEHVGTERQPVAGRVRACLAFVLAEQPDDVGTAVAGLLGGEAVRVHEELRAVGQRRVDRHAEPLDEALGVALVPRRGEHDRRLALGRERLDLARHAQRVEQQQVFVVVDRVGRDVRVPRLARPATPGGVPASATVPDATRARRDATERFAATERLSRS